MLRADEHQRGRDLRGPESGARLLGVLDLDSPVPARFDDQDRAGLQALAAAWIKASRHR